MIAIIDNGRDYSDHTIYFIEVGLNRAVANKRIACMTQPDYTGRRFSCLAVGELDWINPTSCIPWKEFKDKYSMYCHSGACQTSETYDPKTCDCLFKDCP